MNSKLIEWKGSFTSKHSKNSFNKKIRVEVSESKFQTLKQYLLLHNSFILTQEEIIMLPEKIIFQFFRKFFAKKKFFH